ncbi:MAG: PAS domain-containing protein [Oscillatoriophycideae cyanobacterium NC_groundwater_1537_Pr4_S-0.65um_50_18]|nr:PAS domain-containing protein [Oscillatoriophycideae cyanobacterium NC_groundwater_1537_Pr4_S-0.65um_50_18]
MIKPYTILLVDDSAEDRAAYCRYLERGSAHLYQVLEASSAAMGLDLYQRLLPDAILLDYSLPDMDGLAFLAVMQQAGKQVPIVMLTGQGDETIAAQAIKSGAQDYLIKGNLTANGLCKALDHAIEQFQLQQRLKQQEQHQQMLSAIALRIRQALTLQMILDTSVAEVRQYLNADRVLIYQFAPDMSGQIVAEAVLPEWVVSLHVQVEDTCFRQNLGGDYRLGRTRAIDNIYEAGLTHCHIQLLERFQVKANLVVPLLITEQNSDSAEPHHDAAAPQLWGLLVAHQCAATRQWQALEIELLNQVAVQMAVAIQQAELYCQLQNELAERRRTEANLRESEERFRLMADHAPVLLWVADTDGQCTFFNQTWLQFTGRTLAQETGNGWAEGVHPDDLQGCMETYLTALRVHQPFQMEYRLRRADGVYRWLLDHGAPRFASKGEFMGFIGSCIDIDDRKQAETERQTAQQALQASTAALARSEQRYRSLVTATTQAVWTADPEGKTIDDIPGWRTLTGQTEAEVQGWRWMDALHPDDRAKTAEAWRIAATTKQLYAVEHRVRMADGSYKFFVGRAAPVLDEIGNIQEWIGAHTDISDRKHTEITMQQLNQVLETRVHERTAKLRASEARLREAQRIARLGDWEFDLASQNITWSEELFRLFECDPAQGEPEYAEHLQSYVPESRFQLEHAVQQAASLGTPYELELQFARADGVRWLLARGEAVRNVDGAIVKLLGTALDITDRKQTEEVLRNLSDRLNLAVKSGAIAIWDWNITDNILTWDDRMYELYGITPDQFTSVYAAWASSVHPYDRPHAEAAIQQALTGEKDYEHEFRVIHPDGTIRFIKAYALVQRNEQGNPRQMIGINYDITARKQAELENQQLKERLQFVLASSPAVIFTCKPEGDYAATFISDNIQDVVGHTPADFLSESGFWANHIHPEDAPRIFAGLASLFDQGHHTHEYRFLHKNGSYRWMWNGLRLVRDAEANVSEIVGYFVDITDRKQAEQALQQLTIDLQRSNQELEQFAYVASHDLQEPLRAITSYTQLLAKRYQGQLDEKADKYIYYVVDGAARMQQLIQDLLAYSRVGRYELKLQPTDCNVILKQVRNDLQVAIAESNAVITVDALPTIPADTAQVTQLFQNLIGNALKYHGQAAPIIRISASQQGKDWIFSIQDNGIGIEPQYAERIFEIFQRLHTRREYDGTGLGLAICKKIVERHHGRIWVESTLGQGATFYFTLPA